MRAHVRFVGLLMVVVLLAAIVAAAGPVAYIVTLDDQGNSYYLESNGDGTLGPQTPVGNIATLYNHGAGIGEFTDDEFYDFVVGSGYTDGPAKEIYLWANNGANTGDAFLGPDQVGTWSTGTGDLPGEMAVAKFSGKVYDVGSLDDFVMVRWGSPDAGLYRMGTDGKFVESPLTGVAPQYSYGADVADINHDGYADFVVAPVEGNPQIYVNLANGDGTFTTHTFPTYSSTFYTGITAADFDGDYKVDLIATITGSGGSGLDFYKGDGLGEFTWRDRIGSGWLSGESPVDNYDIDNDGDQDLVASNLYNIDTSGVIVGLNDGSGYFTFGFDTIYYGDQLGVHTVIAAPPVFQNELPVADFLITPALPDDNRIAKGTALSFDGRISDDPEFKDMEPNYLEYSWEFEDEEAATTTTATTPVAEYTFDIPGTSFARLTVTDNYAATWEKIETIKVNHPTEAADDTYDTVEKVPLTVDAVNGVLANDEDLDDTTDHLTVSMVSGPAHGMLALNPDGSFTYDPDDDFPGPTDTPTDSFTYMVNDGWNDSNVATVTLEFNAPMSWKVKIVPDKINLKSNGVFIAFITLPKQYRAADVVEGSVACQGAVAVRLIRHSKFFPQTFGAIFRTQDLKDVKAKDKVTLTVTGQVISEGQTLDFSGGDTVRFFSLKSRARDETEDWDRQNDKNIFDKFPHNHGKGQDRDSSGRDGRDQGYDH